MTNYTYEPHKFTDIYQRIANYWLKEETHWIAEGDLDYAKQCKANYFSAMSNSIVEAVECEGY